MRPLVTVLIDTFNHERYVEQTIVSAIEQDFPGSEFEILVVDDGSTDRTPEIVGKFGQRVRLLRKKNGGQASAFNAALPEARGELVAFLDGDDWWLPGKLATVTTALEENSGIAGVGHGYYEFIEATGESKLRKAPQPILVGLNTPEAARKCWHDLRYVHLGAFTVRRTVLESCIPIPEHLVFDADAPIALAAIARGALLLDAPLYYYRIHSNNLDAVEQKDIAKFRRKYEMLQALYDVLYAMLLRMDVPQECVSALLDDSRVSISRHILGLYGGSRIKAFQTEMRHFRCVYKDPSFGRSLFQYAVVAPATLSVPPRQFYKLRDWYARKNLARLFGYFGESQKTGEGARH